jgi:hypothetical protein
MEYRHRLAKAREAEDNIPAALHIRNLTAQEHTRTLFRRIRYLERKMSNPTTSRLVVSDRQEHHREILQRNLIERHLLRANDKKYHQAEGTSQLSKGKLLQDIGALGTGPKIRNILQGRYVPPLGTSLATKDFLKEMKTSDTYRPCAPITFETFKDGWRKTREKTSSSGPHFCHYRAVMHHPLIAKMFYQ